MAEYRHDKIIQDILRRQDDQEARITEIDQAVAQALGLLEQALDALRTIGLARVVKQ
jgi:predicted transcriptional regulator